MKKKKNIKQHTSRNIIRVDINKAGIEDGGNGIVRFKNGLTITDDTEQLNGTKYEIKSMDISKYKGMITANHEDKIENILGKTFGVRKIANRRIVVDGIDFAVKENALALYAKNMLMAGYLTDFSIETIGPWPDDDGVYKDSSLVGLSAVVVGNNLSAHVNDRVVANSYKQAKKRGLDTKVLDKIGLDKSKKIINNDGNMKKKKNTAQKVTKKVSNKKSMEKALQAVMAPLLAKIDGLEQQILDNSAKEPQFKKTNGVKKDLTKKLESMDYKERHALQVQSALDALTGRKPESNKIWREINQLHMEQLKEAGKVSNSITLSDFGNFVINPELLKDIEGTRSDFSGLISRLQYKETNSLQMSWLKRSGDIDMSEVEMCDDDADGNLKPISTYSSSINTANLHELAAVTPVCNAATRFLAVDLLEDAMQGYRTDYDRKRAQLFIARLQQAVDSTGNKTPYDGTSNVTTLQSWIEMWMQLTETVPNGVFVYNYKTQGELLKRLVAAGISGPLALLFQQGDTKAVLGRDSIIVPNELMPSLNTAETKSFTVESTSVSIDQAIFYTDLSTFAGRTSGGLQFDLSTEAAYEENGATKSAFQRNELVMRGSFFRNGAIKDEDKVQSMYAAGVS